MERREAQLAKMKEAEGFIAALDQSGGSTPKALALYGVDEKAGQMILQCLISFMQCVAELLKVRLLRGVG